MNIIIYLYVLWIKQCSLFIRASPCHKKTVKLWTCTFRDILIWSSVSNAMHFRWLITYAFLPLPKIMSDRQATLGWRDETLVVSGLPRSTCCYEKLRIKMARFLQSVHSSRENDFFLSPSEAVLFEVVYECRDSVGPFHCTSIFSNFSILHFPYT